jgi:hypothetical protein
MKDSKAASEHQITGKLFSLASAAIARSRSRRATDRLLGDDEFLEHLADKVAERLRVRQELASAEADPALGAVAKALEQVAAGAALVASPMSDLRWGAAAVAARPTLECCPRCGRSHQDP